MLTCFNVQKHTIFIFYFHIIVFPLCPGRFLQSPSFRQAQSALIGQLTKCIVIGRTPQAHVGNVTPPYHNLSAFKVNIDS